MSNTFYNASGNPANASQGLSALIRGEFVSIQTAFDMMPRITTTGLFDTVINQVGNFTFTLPAAPGTFATTANVATETTRATTAEATISTAVGTETTARIAGDVTEATARIAGDATEASARNTAISVETTRATTAEALLAPKASPSLTGTPTAPTAAPGTNTTQLATTAYSTAAVLVETTRATTAEALLAPKASPSLTGTPTAPTAAPGTNTTQLATTAYSTAAVLVETTRATTAEGTNATAIAAETTRATAAEGVNATAALGAAGIGRNRIHNGGFGINQRAQVSGVALAAGAYGHDRWKAGAGGCTYTFTQNQPTTVITITAGTLQQVIEALTVEGGTYTLSWLGTATARINAGSFLVSPITVTGLAANTTITVEFNTGTVDRAQFEPGSVASAFVPRSYRYELAECQRFFEICSIVWVGDATATSAYAVSVPYAVEKRASPTITSVSQAGSGNALMNARSGSAGLLPTRAASWTGTAVSTGPSRGFNDTFSASADL